MATWTFEVHRGRRKGRWFILGLPGPDRRWCGPYDTKSEALDDARGLARLYQELERNMSASAGEEGEDMGEGELIV